MSEENKYSFDKEDFISDEEFEIIHEQKLRIKDREVNKERKAKGINKKYAAQRNENKVNAARYGVNKGGFKFATIDPNSFEIIRTFNTILQLEHYLGTKNMGQRIVPYLTFGKKIKDSPTICGYIIVRYKEREVKSMDKEQFNDFILERALPFMVLMQLIRVKKHLAYLDKGTLTKLFNYFGRVESSTTYKQIEDDML